MPTFLAPTAGLFFALAQAASPSPAAPAPPPSPGAQCQSAPYRQFDFWIGEWDVTNMKPPAGRTPPVSKSRISRVLDGCAVLEEYETANGYAGKSLNFHDGKSGKWHQVWIDNGGAPLFLEGAMEGSAMVMRDRSDPVNRITWSPVEGGKIRQHWEISRDGGRTWQTSFDGMYTPRAAR
jgi:hypothetical protein